MLKNKHGQNKKASQVNPGAPGLANNAFSLQAQVLPDKATWEGSPSLHVSYCNPSLRMSIATLNYSFKKNFAQFVRGGLAEQF